MLGYLAAGPAAGERALIEMMATRTQEMLSPDEFSVSSDGKTIVVRGVGGFLGKTNFLMPMFIWRAPLPLTQRLDMLCRSHGKRLQEFLSGARGEAWPAEGADLHISITGEAISMWWGGPNEDEAVLRMRPILREEIGV